MPLTKAHAELEITGLQTPASPDSQLEIKMREAQTSGIPKAICVPRLSSALSHG